MAHIGGAAGICNLPLVLGAVVQFSGELMHDRLGHKPAGVYNIVYVSPDDTPCNCVGKGVALSVRRKIPCLGTNTRLKIDVCSRIDVS